jgi:hypothetical protein
MVKRIFDGGLAILCVATLASTDFSGIQTADVIVLACMGAAVLAKIVCAIVMRRKHKA